jgi:hypothetical protein
VPAAASQPSLSKMISRLPQDQAARQIFDDLLLDRAKRSMRLQRHYFLIGLTVL